MRSTWRYLVTAVLALLLVAAIAALGTTPNARAATVVISGTLGDGTLWRVAKPDNWNGTLILDLDGYGNAAPTNPGALQRWMNDNGYAIGGIQREPIGYNFAGAVQHFLDVRTAFIAQFGPVARTLTIGNSRGGFASRIAMEMRPDIFKGAVVSSGGGAGEIATFNQRTDGLFVLKTLVNPNAPIPIGLVVNSGAENTAIGQLATLAMSTPLGRARMGLAGALEQSPAWFSGATPPPTASAWVTAVGSMFAFANPAQVRGGIQAAAGGNTFWTHGIDYAANLEKSSLKQWVVDLYSAAGADLEADLQTLAQARRLAADPAAVAKAEKMMTYSGNIEGPVIMVDNMGDPIDSPAYKHAYEQTIARAGKSHLLRAAYINSTGHGGQTAGEKIAGFVKLIERLDTGSWSATDPATMNALATQIQASTSFSLGRAPLFYAPTPWEPMRVWDGANWGTYQRPTPKVEATVSPPPNAAGWNKGTATVGLTATEDITNFVLSLKYSATGAGGFSEITNGAAAMIPVSAQGVTILTYSASDDEGGASTPAELAIKVDTIAPQTGRSLTPTAAGAWYSPRRVTLTASDSTSGVALTRYRVDGGAWQTYTGPFEITTFGPHTLEYFSEDVAGNVEAVQSLSWGNLSATAQLEGLSGFVGDLGLHKGLTKELQKKLEQAAKHLAKPNDACGRLDGFTKSVFDNVEKGPKQKPKPKLSVADAHGLLSVYQIETTIGCISGDSPEPAAAHALLGILTTIDGFGLSKPVDDKLSKLVREAGKQLVGDKAQQTCKALADLSKKIGEFEADKKQDKLSASQGSELKAQVTEVASLLGC